VCYGLEVIDSAVYIVLASIRYSEGQFQLKSKIVPSEFAKERPERKTLDVASNSLFIEHELLPSTRKQTE
jgi:hypothetical protein